MGDHDHHGLPHPVYRLAKNSYSVTELCPLNGNTTVGTVTEAQSVRQGCPLSIHLFALYIEPLLVRLSNTISGVELHGENVKVRAFVDDLTICVSSHEDILKACQTIEEFCVWTNARINKNKTKLLGLGGWAIERHSRPGNAAAQKPVAQLVRAPTTSPIVDGSILDSGFPSSLQSHNISASIWPVNWVTQVTQLKLLGITFTSNINESIKLNWRTVHHKMIGILSNNRHRNFTFLGRVQFIKQHVISQAIHLAHVLPCSKTQSNHIRQSFGKFLWSNRREHPSLNVLIRPRNQGGLGAIIPFQFFHALLVRSLFKSLIHPEGPERAVATYWLAHPLTKHFPNQQQTAAPTQKAAPSYIKSSSATIVKLLESGHLTTTAAASTKEIYHSLISTIVQTGRTELARPELDWPSIWKWVAKINGREGELVWDYYHNQLPTKPRLKSLHLTSDEACPICKSGPETDEHLMINCPVRTETSSWLRVQLTKLHCKKPIRDAIYGDIGSCSNRRSALTLIYAYITTTWTSRTQLKVPTISELQANWQALLHNHM